MKKWLLLLMVPIIFANCASMDFGGSMSASSVHVSQSEQDKTEKKSNIDIKVEELRRSQNSKIINKYIRKGL